MYGPKTAAGDSLHAMKYRQVGEDFREAANRWAFALKDDDAHYHMLREIFLDMRYLPPGRVQSAMGSRRDVTPYNCFVSGTISDSFVHGEGSIMERAHEAAATMRMGGGIGYDFSTLRPRGDAIRRLQSVSSGPVSFMGIFDEVGRATQSAGHRRGAQMGVMRIDHPDIEEFVHSKTNKTRLNGFNISVAVTDTFMEALDAKKTFPLQWGGKVYAEVDAETLWEKIMRANWDWAEPGVLFIDRINEMNNLYYCETITATNPCGEQPLPPFGACLLGSFNLVRYLRPGQPVKEGSGLTVVPRFSFDWDQFKADIPPIVRAMDNVPDRAKFPLPRQKLEAIGKRRMGLGVTGLANTGEALGYEYGQADFLTFEREVLQVLRDESYRYSAVLAKEKGAFPMYDEERYCKGRFIATLPEDIRALIKKNGIRNSHLTSIAPTGTISMCADNVSSGLEPVLFHSAMRDINTPSGQETVRLEDYGVAFLSLHGKLSRDVLPKEHVAVLGSAQMFVDSAVSKTCNVSSKRTSWEEYKALYRLAYDGGAKGMTTYNEEGQRGSIFKEESAAAVEDGTACEIGPDGRRECSA